MVMYFKYLSKLVQMKTFLRFLLFYFIIIGITNIGFVKLKSKKGRNWMIVFCCIGASMLLFLGVYIVLMVVAGRFPELIKEIGKNPAISFWFGFCYISGKIFERRYKKNEIL